MGQECDAWCWYLEDVYLLHTPHEPDWVRPKHVLENEKTRRFSSHLIKNMI